MKIKKGELAITIEDAKFYFEEPGERALLSLLEVENAGKLSDKVELMFSHMTRVENVEDIDSPSELRELDLPASLIVELLAEFVAAFTAKMQDIKKPGAELKNEHGS